MYNGNRDTLLQFSSAAILGLVNGISAVVAYLNQDNGAYINATPSVLPHQFFRILPRDFSVYLKRHRENIDYTFSIN